ncbi:hypothetical protein K523DRAFT_418772 [Schizophyllum commune Tattone D]|nr:hypothetical protein K523DRAFT_418772 [Schizophyllum commune Tattone D]
MTAPDLNIPSSDATVTLQVFNTADPERTRVLAGTLMTPIPPGREYFHFPIYAFLVENPRLGRRVMFDLGGRDLTTYPAGLQDLLDRLDCTIHADEVAEQLQKGGVGLESIDTVIWSHIHFDHIGDMSKFPPSTQLLVGPETNLKVFPEDSHSALRAEEFAGRSVRELDYSDGLKIGNFDAIDFFGDGSFYVLDCPGHIKGHTCALARVTPTTFVFLGGDICHHPGEFRPSDMLHQTFPCPGNILDAAWRSISSEYFSPVKASKVVPTTGTFEPFDLIKRDHPMLDVVDGDVHEDVEGTRKAIRNLLPFDASPDVLVVIAHDQTLVGEIPLFPKTLNNWKADGLKERVAWTSFHPENPAYRYSAVPPKVAYTSKL